MLWPSSLFCRGSVGGCDLQSLSALHDGIKKPLFELSIDDQGLTNFLHNNLWLLREANIGPPSCSE